MRNVSGDLEEYETELNDYLSRVFDDFGLIIAGWSGVWDPALRNAMLSTTSRRYSWYWLSREEQIEQEAQKIVDQRRAFVLNDSQGADNFFQSLEKQVQAIIRLQLPHPKSSEVFIQITKDCLTRNKSIELNDLIINESRRLKAIIDGEPVDAPSGKEESFFRQSLEKYIEHGKGFRVALANIAYFGSSENDALLIRAVRLLSQNIRKVGGTLSLQKLRYFPSLLSLYAVGIAAISNGRYDLLRQICFEPLEPLFSNGWGKTEYLSNVNPGYIFKESYRMLPPSTKNLYIYNLDYIRNLIREDFRNIFPIDREYESLYHRLEFVLGLLAWKFDESRYIGESFAYYRTVDICYFLGEGKRAGQGWKLIQDLFDGDETQFADCLDEFEETIEYWRRNESNNVQLQNKLDWTSTWNEQN